MEGSDIDESLLLCYNLSFTVVWQKSLTKLENKVFVEDFLCYAFLTSSIS